jgi:hypothetical protein
MSLHRRQALYTSCSKEVHARACQSNGQRNVSLQCIGFKKAVTSADILIHPTPWHLFIIDTDTSGNCISAALQQTKDAFEDFI